MFKKRYIVSLIAVLALDLALVFTVTPGATGAESAKPKREECSLCGMWIDLYMKTRHVVTLDDGSSESFCSIACAAKYVKQHKGAVKRVQAADFETTELVEAEKAFYLEGSDIPGVMSYTSRLAFTTRGQAERYQKEHGGKIITFQEALKSIERE